MPALASKQATGQHRTNQGHPGARSSELAAFYVPLNMHPSGHAGFNSWTGQRSEQQGAAGAPGRGAGTGGRASAPLSHTEQPDCSAAWEQLKRDPMSGAEHFDSYEEWHEAAWAQLERIKNNAKKTLRHGST